MVLTKKSLVVHTALTLAGWAIVRTNETASTGSEQTND